MGTTPNNNPPTNLNFVYDLANLSDVQDHNEASIEAALGVDINVSWETAHGVHDAQVVGKFADLEGQIEESGNVVGNHENRIIRLESGNVVAEYFSNDVWTKPTIDVEGSPMDYHHHEFIGIGGGGGGRRPNWVGSGERVVAYGGGQGGFGSHSALNDDVGATVNVVIGPLGTRATSNNTNGSAGGATSFTDSVGLIYSAGGGAGGTASGNGVRGSNTTFTDWNAYGGRGWGTIGGSEAAAQPGQNGYLCVGGAVSAANATPGGNGQPCPAGRIGPGAGGAGGWAHGPGGNGGFPGGGGGAGGCNMYTGDTGNGGNGAIGRAIIVSYVSA